MDEVFDNAKNSLRSTDSQLKAYLREVQEELNCKQITYVSLQKDSHVFEIPEVSHSFQVFRFYKDNCLLLLKQERWAIAPAMSLNSINRFCSVAVVLE